MNTVLTNKTVQEEKENNKPEAKCGENHKLRVAHATLELAIDVSTDFSCHNV
jgi:hypothetical protein